MANQYLPETEFNSTPEAFSIWVTDEGVVVESPSVRSVMDWEVAEKLYSALAQVLYDRKQGGFDRYSRQRGSGR